MPDEVADAIEQAAQDPKRVMSDGTEVEMPSIREQIEADRYLASREAANVTSNLGIKRNKMVPPGSV